MTHLSLAWLMGPFPPLLAEKLLASTYLLGFAWSFRYYLGAFGKDALKLAPTVFLFSYNRCFLMGFYNYCLSLVPFWLVLGYCIRKNREFALRDSLVLSFFLLVAYFTHLLGYALACVSVPWITLTTPPRRLSKFFCVACALLPMSSFALWSLARPKLLGLREAAPSWGTAANLWPSGFIENVISSVTSMNQSFFESYETRYFFLSLTVLLFYELMVITNVLDARHSDSWLPEQRRIAVLGFMVFGLYLILPDFLSLAVGFLKARFALIAPLVWLAILRMPRRISARYALLTVLYLALLLNIGHILNHFRFCNAEIAEYLRGMDRVGNNRTLFVASPLIRHSQQTPLVNHLEHAADYYCLATHNVNLDNFQASTRHFPVRYRTGVFRAFGGFANYPQKSSIDILLSWRIAQNPDSLGRDLSLIFRSDSMEIYERQSRLSPPASPLSKSSSSTD